MNHDIKPRHNIKIHNVLRRRHQERSEKKYVVNYKKLSTGKVIPTWGAMVRAAGRI